MAQFQSALAFKPKDGKAYQGLGEVMQAKGQNDEALQYLRQAVSLKPSDPEIHKDLGVVLSRKGLRKEAILHLSQAIKLRPNYSEAEAALRSVTGQPIP
jgi:superkiller protein 3